MKTKLDTLWAALKLAYDSLIRKYTPYLVGLILGGLTSLLPEVPEEAKAFVGLVVAFVAAVLWYGIARLYEVITDTVSAALTLGLTAVKPVTYATSELPATTISAELEVTPRSGTPAFGRVTRCRSRRIRSSR